MTSFEKTVSSKNVFDGKIINVRLDEVELSNGSRHPREVVEHNGAVCIVAVDEHNNAVVVTQYRYAIGKELMEIPAGKLEKGEKPLPAAVRELEEETGFTAGEMIFLGSMYSSPGFCSEKLYLYLDLELKKGEPHPDEDEFLNVSLIPLDELERMIMLGQIEDGKTVAGVLKASCYLRQSRQE